MIEVVINRCPRGTLMSDAGKAEYLKRKNLSADFDWSKLDRSDPVLVQMFKEDTGRRIWGGECSTNAIIELPDGFPWRIASKEGREWIAADVT